ncbi:MAG TPA: PQQ-dependent sugar dehydrogenase [Myxococcota bacterium]|nr:PQQ-dependent sugar dehydrogenase [Myxococcota bacterium]
MPGTDGGTSGGLCDGITPVAGTAITAQLVEVANAPVDLAAPPGDTGRLFVVEQGGTIRIIDLTTDTFLPTPFVDITVAYDSGEQGLLGIAFHPDYATNGRFFVYYTEPGSANNVVAEFTRSAGDPNVANTAGSVLLTIPNDENNHNGGALEFGPDGLLYIGSGDGGAQHDPGCDAQDLNSLLGKILRIDVDAGSPYAIPPSNPFAGGGGAPEVFAYGFRNPWRISFDRATGDFYVADVGQDDYEEVTVAPAPSNGLGLDFGWNRCEGNSPHPGAPACALPNTCAGSFNATVAYPHLEGCAVIGGYVYRGCRMPDLHGTYFYSDNCDGWLRTFVYAGGVATMLAQDPAVGFNFPSTWGEDARGELYAAEVYDGSIYRIVPQ